MHAILLGANVLKQVQGTEAPPTGNTGSAATKKYEENRGLALSLLWNSLGTSAQQAVESYLLNEDPHGMWTTLQTIFDLGTNTIAAARLREQFEEEKWRTDDMVNSWYGRITSYQNNLANTEYAITDKQVALKLVMKLPSHWSTIKETIFNTIPDLDLRKVLSTLQYNAGIVKNPHSEDTSAQTRALSTRADRRGGRNTSEDRNHRSGSRTGGRGEVRKSDRNQREKNRTNIQCYYCAKHGHVKKDCRIKAAAEALVEDKTNKSSTSYSIVPTSIENNATVKAFATYAEHPAFDTKSWFLDSGATNHICCNRASFASYEDFNVDVFFGDDSNTKANGKGSMQLYTVQGSLELLDTLFVPTFSANLLSIQQLQTIGYDIRFPGSLSHATIVNSQGELIAEGLLEKNTNLYRLETVERQPNVRRNKKLKARALSTALTTKDTRVSYELWHRRLGHLNKTDIYNLADGLANGIRIANRAVDVDNDVNPGNEVNTQDTHDTHDTPTVCHTCMEAKQVKAINKGKVQRPTERLERVHSDVKGPFPEPTFDGYRYFILYIDDLTRMTWIYLLKTTNHSEVLTNFKELKAHLEARIGRRIVCFRCDNGRGEYANQEFKDFLKLNQIEYQPSVPYHQHQNGVAERTIRTVIEKGMAMLHDACLPMQFWGEAMKVAVHLHNVSPTAVLGDKESPKKTPHEAWYSVKPNISNLRRFGCDVHVLEAARTNTMKPKSKLCTLVGYMQNARGIWLVWNPQRRTVEPASSVRFDEHSIGGRSRTARSMDSANDAGNAASNDLINHRPAESTVHSNAHEVQLDQLTVVPVQSSEVNVVNPEMSVQTATIANAPKDTSAPSESMTTPERMATKDVRMAQAHEVSEIADHVREIPGSPKDMHAITVSPPLESLDGAGRYEEDAVVDSGPDAQVQAEKTPERRSARPKRMPFCFRTNVVRALLARE